MYLYSCHFSLHFQSWFWETKTKNQTIAEVSETFVVFFFFFFLPSKLLHFKKGFGKRKKTDTVEDNLFLGASFFFHLP